VIDVIEPRIEMVAVDDECLVFAAAGHWRQWTRFWLADVGISHRPVRVEAEPMRLHPRRSQHPSVLVESLEDLDDEVVVRP
jgi:hypothetical protein